MAAGLIPKIVSSQKSNHWIKSSLSKTLIKTVRTTEIEKERKMKKIDWNWNSVGGGNMIKN